MLKMTHNWYDSFRTAILETDWTKMQERLQTAEREIHERQYALSLDHGGTPEERQAIAEALHGIAQLKTESGDWRRRQIPESDA
jgi:hypothetical protein